METFENLKIGQMWKYDNREGEEDSIVTIVKLDEDKLGKIVHISVENLKIKNPKIPSGVSEYVSHLPFSDQAFLSSVKELIGERKELPSFEEGYNTWREAYDSGNGGVFTIGIKDAIQIIEDSLK